MKPDRVRGQSSVGNGFRSRRYARVASMLALAAALCAAAWVVVAIPVVESIGSR